MKKQFTSTMWTLAVAAMMTTAIGIVGCRKDGMSNDEVDYNASSNKGAKTAQSVMIDINIPNNLSFNETEVWAFDELAAAKALFGYDNCNPATSGAGNGNSCRSSALNSARNAKCSLWTANKQFWSLQETRTSGPAEVSITAKVYGLSAVTMKKGLKYSFGLLDADSVTRISGLQWSTDNSTWNDLDHSIVDASTDSTILDAFYFGNAGAFGNTSLLPADGQSIRDILDNDGFTGNEGKAQMGQTVSFKLPLKEGTTTIYIRGTVKGNDGMSNSSFTGTKTLTVQAGNCN